VLLLFKSVGEFFVGYVHPLEVFKHLAAQFDERRSLCLGFEEARDKCRQINAGGFRFILQTALGLR
jgi:hypothetical protein